MTRALLTIAVLLAAAAAPAQGPIDARHALGLFDEVLGDTVTVPDGVIPVEAPHLRLVWDEDAVPPDEFGDGRNVLALDWDGDGDQDIFVGRGMGVLEPSRLLVNDGAGRFVPAAVEGLPTHGQGAATADFDGDGRGDLVLEALEAPGLERGWRQDWSLGGGRGPQVHRTLAVLLSRAPDGFVTLPILPPGPGNPGADAWAATSGLSSDRVGLPVDMDRDGRIDLLVVGLNSLSQTPNLWLLRNTGQALVAESVATLSPRDDMDRWSQFTTSLLDVDGDGWTDLVLNMGAGFFAASSPMVALRNEGGRLAAAPDTLDVPLQAKDRVQWLDLDADGDADLLATQNDAQGSRNDLYLNDGHGRWRPLGAATGLWAGYSYQTTLVGDLDQDGLPDLVALRMGNTCTARQVAVLRNLGGGRFGTVQGALDPSWSAPIISGVLVDIDGDLDLDLVATGEWIYYEVGDPESSRVRVYRNESRGGRSLVLRLEGVLSHREARGAVVRVRTGGLVQRRQPGEGAVMGTISPPPDIHVGLGAADACDSVTVRWPSGLVECWTGLEAGRLHQLVEGKGVVLE